jgi:deoxyribodipyrimidine photo-lyase
MFKKHQTKFFLYSGIKSEKVNSKSLNEKLLSHWIKGATESDFINANMLELKQTGFMSNRGRQNVASYFCNELNMDWRLGASYFEEQLIDYDVCNNWGNWAYIFMVKITIYVLELQKISVLLQTNPKYGIHT